MHRFFADKSAFCGGSAHISGDDVAHITRVLRLKETDNIILCDGEKIDYKCTITHIDKNSVDLKIDDVVGNEAESSVRITLYQGLPKSDKMDFIIQKCVELGVAEIVPVQTDRCVAKFKDDGKKLLRWQRIAEEAAKQSGRGIIPTVSEATTFDEAVRQEHSLKLIPYECERDGSLKKALSEAKNAETIGIYIGPEGGFEESEVSLARENGVKAVTLGKRILRCETAGLATVSAVMFALDQWDI